MTPKGKPTTRGRQPAAARDAIDSDDDLEDFSRQSEEEEVIFEILDALENASVDPRQRQILWPDGARLSIEQTARRIQVQSGMPLDSIQSHVVGWLQMSYEPQGLNEHQMAEFELLVAQWTEPYEDLP